MGRAATTFPGRDVYTQGLRSAERLARELFARGVAELASAEVHAVLERLRAIEPAFFTRLRTDVATL